MCTSPVTLKRDGFVQKVPCGRCLQCLRAYQRDIAARISEEVKAWLPSHVGDPVPIVFGELSYDEDSVPKNVVFPSQNGVCISKTRGYNVDTQDYCIEDLNDWNFDSKCTAPKSKIDSYHKELSDTFLSWLDYYGFGDKYRTSYVDVQKDIPLSVLLGFDGEKEFVPFGVCINSVRLSDVQTWFKLCRQKIERNKLVPTELLHYHDNTIKYNSRMQSHWFDKGVKKCYPFACYTPTFKYFLCAEYGPGTLRPHYHFILFGVTLQEFREHLGPLWKHGFVWSDVFDYSRGGATYVAKYCSKGSFDHPLCSRDYFKTDEDGKVIGEFHSKHYDDCIFNFGCDFPVVDKPFRVMSKGLGLRYAFDSSLHSYHNVELFDIGTDRPLYVTRSIGMNYAPCDCNVVQGSQYIDMRLKYPNGEEFPITAEEYRCMLRGFQVGNCRELDINAFDWDFAHGFNCLPDFSKSTDDHRFSGVMVRIYRYDARFRCIGFSEYYPLDKPSLIMDELYSQTFKYTRAYVHKGKSEVFSASLPRYYTRYLVSPVASYRRQAFILRKQREESLQLERQADATDYPARTLANLVLAQSRDAAARQSDNQRSQMEHLARTAKISSAERFGHIAP